MNETSNESFEVGSDAMMRAIVESNVSPFVVVDSVGQIAWVSDRIEALLGAPAEHYIGRHFLEILEPASHEVALAAYDEFIERELDAEPWIGPPMLLELLDSEGGTVTCEVSASLGNAHGVDGAILQVRRWRGTALLHTAVDALASGEPLHDVLSHLAAVIDHDMPGSEVVVVADWDGRRFDTIATAPSASEEVMAFIEEFHRLDCPPWHLEIGGECSPQAESAAREVGFVACWTVPVVPPGDDEPTAAVLVLRRVSGRPAAHLTTTIDRVARLIALTIESDRNRRAWQESAFTDGLTGLLNRAGVDEQLVRRREAAGDTPMALLFCDLDRFKQVNDRRGHNVGDHILRVVGERLQHAVRRSDLVARWGGDEFLVVCDSPERASRLAERLIAQVNRPILVGEELEQVGMSVGVALAPGHVSFEDTLEISDSALRQAKEAGRNQYALVVDLHDGPTIREDEPASRR